MAKRAMEWRRVGPTDWYLKRERAHLRVACLRWGTIGEAIKTVDGWIWMVRAEADSINLVGGMATSWKKAKLAVETTLRVLES